MVQFSVVVTGGVDDRSEHCDSCLGASDGGEETARGGSGEPFTGGRDSFRSFLPGSRGLFQSARKPVRLILETRISVLPARSASCSSFTRPASSADMAPPDASFGYDLFQLQTHFSVRTFRQFPAAEIHKPVILPSEIMGFQSSGCQNGSVCDVRVDPAIVGTDSVRPSREEFKTVPARMFLHVPERTDSIHPVPEIQPEHAPVNVRRRIVVEHQIAPQFFAAPDVLRFRGTYQRRGQKMSKYSACARMFFSTVFLGVL